MSPAARPATVVGAKAGSWTGHDRHALPKGECRLALEGIRKSGSDANMHMPGSVFVDAYCQYSAQALLSTVMVTPGWGGGVVCDNIGTPRLRLWQPLVDTWQRGCKQLAANVPVMAGDVSILPHMPCRAGLCAVQP